MSKVRILSLDGGGIRGIISAEILCYLESAIQKKVGRNIKLAEYFDFIAGTSTGGIIASAMLLQDDKSLSMEEIRDIYVKRGEEIFPENNIKKWLSKVFGVQFTSKGLELIFQEIFKDVKLSDVKPCLITAYESQDRRAHFFCSLDAKKDSLYQFYLKDVVRATSAAPTYFKPAKINSEFGKTYSMLDGGVFANNPTLCAYAEARKIDFSLELNNPSKPVKPGAKDMFILSIGTGSVKSPYTYNRFANAGQISWVKPLIDIMMSSNSETVCYQLYQMFKTLDVKDQSDYIRLEPSIRLASSDMANVTELNIEELQAAGKTFVEENKQNLDNIVKRLIEEE